MNFGYIDCAQHGPHKRAWFICRHLKTLLDVQHHFEWNEKEGGSLCCGIDPEAHDADDLTIVCEGHLKDMGLFERVH